MSYHNFYETLSDGRVPSSYWFTYVCSGATEWKV